MKYKNVIKKHKRLKRKNTEYYKKALLRSMKEIGGAQWGDAELLNIIYSMPRFKETKETIIKACGEDGFQEILDYIRKHEK